MATEQRSWSRRLGRILGEIVGWSVFLWGIVGLAGFLILALSDRGVSDSFGLAALIVGILLVLVGAFGLHAGPIRPFWILSWSRSRFSSTRVQAGEDPSGKLTALGIALFVAPQLLVVGAVLFGTR